MSAPRDDIPAGSVWRQVKLGTEAVYEVLESGASTVEVSVRVAPGLEPGTRVQLSRSAIEAMERVSEPAPHAPHARKRSGSGQRSAPGGR
jgi:hypothetical protein